MQNVLSRGVCDRTSHDLIATASAVAAWLVDPTESGPPPLTAEQVGAMWRALLAGRQ